MVSWEMIARVAGIADECSCELRAGGVSPTVGNTLRTLLWVVATMSVELLAMPPVQ